MDVPPPSLPNPAPYSYLGPPSKVPPTPRILTRELAGGGTSGQVLTSNGPLSPPTFQAAASGGSPGGSNTQVQYNNSSAFGGSAGITLTSTQVTGMAFSDTTTGNATSTSHGLVVKTPADAAQFLNGAATAAYAQVKDSDLSTSDITTNNVTTSKHGFAPKGDNNAAHYLDGTGAYSTPAGGSGAMSLLKANSGTDTSAGATNVDTYALSGLTAKDSLMIFFTLSSLTQQTANPLFYSSTDSVELMSLRGGFALSAGQTIGATAILRQEQHASTTIFGWTTGNTSVATGGGTVGNQTGSIESTNVTTAWTGSWTLALRHNGVTAGGTFRWSWAIFKIAGQ